MKRIRQFRDDIRGISAVEFALVLPFIAMLMMGGYELTQGVNTDRKITLAARTVADLTAQDSSSAPDYITVATMNNLIMTAGKTVIAPYDQSLLKIVISSIRINDSGAAKIEWSVSTPNTTSRAVNSTPAIDANLLVKNTNLIWAEVTYPYTPMFGATLTGTIDLKEQLFMRPRNKDCVKYNNTGCA